MSEAGGIQGVVVGHGEIAKGLVGAVLRISGTSPESLIPISNDGMSPEALEEEITRILQMGPTLLFTDLPSGSCAMAARICCRGNPEAAAIFGVNLPILLDFVFHRDLPMSQLVPRLLAKGQASMTSLPE